MNSGSDYMDLIVFNSKKGCDCLLYTSELGVKEVMVVAHSDCGACHMNSNEMIEHMKARGSKQETIDIDLYKRQALYRVHLC